MNALIVNGKVFPLQDELTTRQAAKVLGVSLRRMQAICDEGRLLEGTDWRKIDAGTSARYHIKRDSVLRLRLGPDQAARQ